MTDRPLALVTGANKNIGLAIARGLGRAGMTVLLGARDVQAGAAAAEALRDQGLDVVAISLDVTRADSVAGAVRAAEARGGHLDVLVNNAGISDLADGEPGSAAPEAVARILGTNFLGAHAVTRAFLPLLRRAPAARIVNVSSSLGSLALAARTDTLQRRNSLLGYAASKAALDMFTILLARELAGTPIKVNAAAPGYTPTDLNKHLPPPPVPAQSIDDAAVVPVRLALLPADGPTGRFFDVKGEVPW